MTKKRYWWPLALDDGLEALLAAHTAALSRRQDALDLELADSADRKLVEFLAKPVHAIIARDGLPYLGHVFVGWGNATVDGHPLLDRVASFVHQDQHGKPYIYQCHSEGDYHPWQTYAYTMMAGISPDARIGTSPFTLREVAENSTVIRTSAMHDLGHLMYAFAAMKLPATMTFTFDGKPLTLPELVEHAIHAHHFGPFYVCRKFHLTEGLCAIAAAYPELAGYKEVAQKFLDGQLDVMLTFSLLLSQIEAVAAGDMAMADSQIPALRKAMLIGTLMENHIYSAGHVIELAALSLRMGYRLTPAHIGAIHHILNHLNGCVVRSLDRFAPMAAFLPMGHYRRALTLYRALSAVPSERWGDNDLLTGYQANFDACAELVCDAARGPVDALYTIAAHAPKIRPFFQSVLDEFSQGNSTGMTLYGGFNHFRRLHPDTWPRQVHFEFLDYADRVGVELHFENPDLLPLMDAVSAHLPDLQAKFAGVQVDGLRRTDRSEAKIRLYLTEAHGPVAISRFMHEFVDYMQPIVSAEMNNPAHGIVRTRSDIHLN